MNLKFKFSRRNFQSQGQPTNLSLGQVRGSLSSCTHNEVQAGAMTRALLEVRPAFEIIMSSHSRFLNCVLRNRFPELSCDTVILFGLVARKFSKPVR